MGVMAFFSSSENVFLSIFFEKISVLDSYFIHRYMITKYRSSSIEGKIHHLSWELWPFLARSAQGEL